MCCKGYTKGQKSHETQYNNVMKVNTSLLNRRVDVLKSIHKKSWPNCKIMVWTPSDDEHREDRDYNSEDLW